MGQQPQSFQFLVDVLKKFDRVGSLVLLVQSLFLLWIKESLLQQAVVRSPGSIIHLADPGPLTMFFLQLHHRLEEVDIAFYQG
ncbi:MAG: hypothetical protein OXE17_05595 [Chloroflexi bacterium]|nr:hypothetical protein [Chloroflexota bacterium]